MANNVGLEIVVGDNYREWSDPTPQNGAAGPSGAASGRGLPPGLYGEKP